MREKGGERHGEGEEEEREKTRVPGGQQKDTDYRKHWSILFLLCLVSEKPIMSKGQNYQLFYFCTPPPAPRMLAWQTVKGRTLLVGQSRLASPKDLKIPCGFANRSKGKFQPTLYQSRVLSSCARESQVHLSSRTWGNHTGQLEGCWWHFYCTDDCTAIGPALDGEQVKWEKTWLNYDQLLQNAGCLSKHLDLILKIT